MKNALLIIILLIISAVKMVNSENIEIESIEELTLEQIKEIGLTDAKLAAELLDYKIEKHKRDYPAKFFIPNGAQERAIRAIAESDNKLIVTICLTYPNGVGKTALLWNIIYNLTFGIQSEWFDYELFRNWPFPKKIRYYSTGANLEENGAVDIEYKAWFPRKKIKYSDSKNGKHYISKVKIGDWTLNFMSYDQDVKQSEGPTFGLIIMDEPSPEKLYDVAVSRLRKGGKLIMIMTPLEGAEWVYDRVVTQADGKSVIHLDADIEENCKQHGIRGQLEHSVIESMLSKYSTEELEARSKGKFMFLKKTVYGAYIEPDKHFNPPISLKEITLKENSKKYTYWMVMDPHDARYSATLWYAVDKTNTIYNIFEFPAYKSSCAENNIDLSFLAALNCASKIITDKLYHELGTCKLGIDDIKEIITSIENYLGIEVDGRILDPRFGSKKVFSSDKTVQEELNSKGFNFQLAEFTNIETGHRAVKDFLTISNITGYPRFFVFPHCYNHKYQILRYSRNEYNHKTAEKHGIPEGKIQEKYKDFNDLDRYLCQRKILFFDKSAVNMQPYMDVDTLEAEGWS